MSAPIGHGYCWAERPDSYARCTQDPGHKGPHYDWRAPSDQREWLNSEAAISDRTGRESE